MTQKLSLLIGIVLLSLCGTAQSDPGGYLYRGQMDGKLNVTMYLHEGTNECNGNKIYSGMYKYDGVSKWLLLEIRVDSSENYIMIERPYTGTMQLKKKLNQLIGVWLSPDGQRRLKVQWRQQPLSTELENEYSDQYEKRYYEINDC